MPQETMRVGVVVLATPPATARSERGHRPCGILPIVPATAPATVIARQGGVETFYAGDAAIVLHSGETAHYVHNLASARPAVWVALKAGGIEPFLVTVDPYEGEGLAGDPALVVEAVAMPSAVRERVRAFIERFHVEERFVKRKRQRADPEGLARRAPRVLGIDEDRG